MQSSLSVLLLCLPTVFSAAATCYQCASPALQSNWEITSFPKMPSYLTFDEICNGNPGDFKKVTFEVPCGDSACMEMMIPLEGRPVFLRGCYKDFVDSSNVTGATADTCTYGTPSGNNTIKFGAAAAGTAASTTGQSLIRLCTLEADCNKMYIDEESMYAKPAIYFEKCNQASTKKCISCSRYASTGTCKYNSEETCTGAYCVKYDGYFADEWFEIRGCAPISPFVGDQCSTIEQDTGVTLDQGSLNVHYKGSHCYCSGEKCNPASRLLSSSLLSLLLLPLVPFLLSSLSFFCS